MHVLRILGVDPGSRFMGFAVLDVLTGAQENRHYILKDCGTLKVGASTRVEDRLLEIHHGLARVIEATKPAALSIEKVFFAKNALSALKLGQARGAAILTAAIHGLEMFEYAPTEVKASIVGNGRADKEQVAKMLKLLLGRHLKFDGPDASDAVAIALCHAQRISLRGAKPISPTKTQTSKRRMSLAEAVGLKK